MTVFRNDLHPEPTNGSPQGIWDAMKFDRKRGRQGASTTDTRSAKRAPRPKPVGVELRRDRGDCADRLVAREPLFFYKMSRK